MNTMEEQLFSKFGKTFNKGTYLFHDRDEGTEMYVIQEGRVAIIKESSGVEKVLATIEKGDFFGEMSILTKKPRSATAKVIEDSKILVINPSTFEAMIRGDANIAIRMLQKLADRLAQTDAQIENLLLKDPMAKVVHYLKTHTEKKNSNNMNEGDVIIVLADISRNILVEADKIKEIVAKLAGTGLLKQISGSQFKVPDIKNFNDLFDYLAKKEKFREFS